MALTVLYVPYSLGIVNACLFAAGGGQFGVPYSLGSGRAGACSLDEAESWVTYMMRMPFPHPTP